MGAHVLVTEESFIECGAPVLAIMILFSSVPNVDTPVFKFSWQMRCWPFNQIPQKQTFYNVTSHWFFFFFLVAMVGLMIKLRVLIKEV